MPDPIEVTVSLSRDDLKRTAHYLARSGRGWTHLKAVAWAVAAFLAFFAEQLSAAGIFAYLAAYNFALPSAQIWWKLRKTPEWAYGATTFSLDESGVFQMTPQASCQLGWDAIGKVILTDADWIFNAAGQEPIVLPRGTLSEKDEAAVRAMAEHYGR